jgi:hypothetical protein
LIPIADEGGVVPLRIVLGIAATVLPADLGFETDAFVAAKLCAGRAMRSVAVIRAREVRFMGLLKTID